jgi:hypothetical protein
MLERKSSWFLPDPKGLMATIQHDGWKSMNSPLKFVYGLRILQFSKNPLQN